MNMFEAVQKAWKRLFKKHVEKRSFLGSVVDQSASRKEILKRRQSYQLHILKGGVFHGY